MLLPKNRDELRTGAEGGANARGLGTRVKR